MLIESYKDLRVWQTSVDLAVRCYELTKGFPRDEMFGLSSQIRRAATSVAANIAEGHGRETTGAFIQSLRIAQGSLKELETHWVIASRIGYVTKSEYEELAIDSEGIGKMIRALIRTLQRDDRKDRQETANQGI